MNTAISFAFAGGVVIPSSTMTYRMMARTARYIWVMIRATLGEKLAARLPEGLSLSEETADIDGGFILRDGNISLNGSLEAVLNAGKKELTGKVAGILFP